MNEQQPPLVKNGLGSIVAAPIGEVVKQTLYRKYQRALDDLGQLQRYLLRTKSGKIHPALEAEFKASVGDLVIELRSKLKNEKDMAEVDGFSQKVLFNPRSVTLEQYKYMLVQCGDFLDRAGVTKIYAIPSSGSSAWGSA